MTLQTINSSDYVTALRDKIKTALVDIIPNEKWDAMIKAEVEIFFNVETYQQDNWGNKIPLKVTYFRNFVLQQLHEEVNKRLQEYFKSDDWCAKWNPNSGEYDASIKMKELIAENAQTIFANSIASAFQNVIQNMKFIR